MTGKLNIALGLLLAAAVLLFAAIRVPPLLPGMGSSLHYETGEVTYGPIRKFVSTSGPVRALVTVSVGSQLSGQISELKVDFNSEVKAGDELAVIDDKTYKARVEQAKADLAAAQAMLAHQSAALIKAEAIARNADRILKRQQTLASKGIAADSTLDNAIRDTEVAVAEVSVAKAQVENAKATIAQREAQLAQALVDLDRTRIRSPIDGTVVARTIDVGQTVAASLQAPELFKIAQDLRRIRIEAQVSEADVGAVVAGNAVEFKVDAYPGRRFSGKVSQLRLGGTELNNIVTYTVIIEADNDDRMLLPSMTADAKVEATRVDRALRVPNDALRFRPRGEIAKTSPHKQAIARFGRDLEQARHALGLTEEQVERVLGLMKGPSAEYRPRGASGSAVASNIAGVVQEGEPELRLMQRLTLAVGSVITDAQRPAFDAWKAARESSATRSSRRNAAVWVLNASGAIEGRAIDLGIMDDHFAEVVGGNLTEGDRIVIRSREIGRK